MNPRLGSYEIFLTPALYFRNISDPRPFYSSPQSARCGICHVREVITNLCDALCLILVSTLQGKQRNQYPHHRWPKDVITQVTEQTSAAAKRQTPFSSF